MPMRTTAVPTESGYWLGRDQLDSLQDWAARGLFLNGGEGSPQELIDLLAGIESFGDIRLEQDQDAPLVSISEVFGKTVRARLREIVLGPHVVGTGGFRPGVTLLRSHGVLGESPNAR
jgi:hypothetical protein